VEATADAGMATDPPTGNENNGEAVDEEQAEEAEDEEGTRMRWILTISQS
jgi:hypothetical protein